MIKVKSVTHNWLSGIIILQWDPGILQGIGNIEHSCFSTILPRDIVDVNVACFSMFSKNKWGDSLLGFSFTRYKEPEKNRKLEKCGEK